MASKKEQREAREARDRLKAYTARQEVHVRQDRRRVRDNVVAIVGVVVIAALATTGQIGYFTAGPGAPTPEPTETFTDGQNVGVPEEDYAQYRMWTGELVLNDVTLGIELDGAAAPQAVSAFLWDVENGYYPGTTCHRMANSPGFQLLQCGSIDGAGSSDPDFHYGPIENAPAEDLYEAGAIAMARASGDAYSNGHQFFILTGDSTIPSDTAGGYTIIGRVTSGLQELIDQIVVPGIDPEAVGEDGTGAPLIPVTIRAATLE